MEEPQPRIFARSSAFEVLLARVYLELWELQDNPTMFARRVEVFAKCFLPTRFRQQIAKEFPDLEEKITKLEAKIVGLEKAKLAQDPLGQEAIDAYCIPAEDVEFAFDVWHAIVDVLTKAGFNFPIDSPTSFFDPSGGKKSGFGERKGFPPRLPDMV